MKVTKACKYFWGVGQFEKRMNNASDALHITFSAWGWPSLVLLQKITAFP